MSFTRRHVMGLAAGLSLSLSAGFAFAADPLKKLSTKADLDTLITTTTNAPLRQALADNAAAIQAALKAKAARDHVTGVLTSANAAFRLSMMRANRPEKSVSRLAGAPR